ncbi:MAG: hypothetical protein GDA56_29925 [Hormoscilla sp. GM7CHS1pb]|nr:hypothetical protein [Hormoscilla sp. GM7CHS1pb]
MSVSLTGAPAISLTGAQPLIFPRKEVKAHGTQRLIEGHYEPGEKVVVVDDILITGNSVMQGAEKLQSVGLEVRDIVVFIDLPGVKDKLQAHGYRGHAVLTLAEIAVSLTRFLFTHPVVRQQATTWVGGSVNDRERSHIPHGSAAITLAERIDDRQFQLLI